MAQVYKFSEKGIEEIVQARKLILWPRMARASNSHFPKTTVALWDRFLPEIQERHHKHPGKLEKEIRASSSFRLKTPLPYALHATPDKSVCQHLAQK